jgi:hypothetical protein
MEFDSDIRLPRAVRLETTQDGRSAAPDLSGPKAWTIRGKGKSDLVSDIKKNCYFSAKWWAV